MKNKKLFFTCFLGALVCFIVFVLSFLLMQKWQIFGSGPRSLESIIFEGISVSIFFLIFFFFFSKNHLKKQQKER
jgi:DMSO/TMAO reductase YedYZ heme-binding membrane subunit